MPNMASIIKKHNRKILSTQNRATNKCNCRQKVLCPLNGDCRTNTVVYEATVIQATGERKTYIGMTENEFKTRYSVHKSSFKHQKLANSTTLSKHLWELKSNNIEYQLKWRIIKRASAYNGSPSRCNLCLAEKMCILQSNSPSLLNKRSELITKCRHENKFYASNQAKKNTQIGILI